MYNARYGKPKRKFRFHMVPTKSFIVKPTRQLSRCAVVWLTLLLVGSAFADNSKISPDLRSLLTNPSNSVNVIVQYNSSLTSGGIIGGIINLLREAAEFVDVRTENDASPDPTDNAFCACAEQGHAAFIATLNRKDFPQQKLVAKVISPGDPIPTTRRRRSCSPQGPRSGRAAC